MPRLVAFIRGINVGGRVAKKEKLQEAFTSLGLQNVEIYKQSGNVIFETNAHDLEEVKEKIERRLSETLGYNVTIFIRSTAQLKAILKENPFEIRRKEGTSYLVTLLPAPISPLQFQLPVTIPKSTAKILSSKDTEIYSETHGGGEGALPNPFIETRLKTKATTRNINIIEEIVAKCG